MAGGKVYSFEEVRKHRDAKDCWLVMHGKVYDVTAFTEEHPGGEDVLLACTGKDATEDFEDIGHSESAKEMMAQYYIGEIDAATMATKLFHDFATAEGTATSQGASTPAVWRTVLQLVAPLLLAAMIYFIKTKME